MSNYKIKADALITDALYAQLYHEPLPISLQRDFKKCFSKNIDKEKDRLLKDLGKEMSKPITSHHKLKGITQQAKASIVKIRLSDPDGKSGKSGGYRCIVLINTVSNEALLLHIYSKKDKDDLTKEEIEVFNYLYQSFIESI